MDQQPIKFTPKKPFKTYEEQLELINKKNITIVNKNEAIQMLSAISYYTLINGYRKTFLSDPQKPDNFINGVTLNHLYTFHNLDNSLSNILFKYIIKVEKSYKTTLSYLIGQKYGEVNFDRIDPQNQKLYPNYLKYGNYNKSNPNLTKNILSSLNQIIENVENNKTKNESLIHYNKTNKHIPPWILIPNITFGLSLKYYSILKSIDKKTICSTLLSPHYQQSLTIEEQKELTKNALEMLREYRNYVAHGQKTFECKIETALPKQILKILDHKILSEQEYRQKLGQRDLFSIILAISILTNDPNQLEAMIIELNTLLKDYQLKTIADNKILSVFNLPDNIFVRLGKLYECKFKL